jgi:hypothetical protein
MAAGLLRSWRSALTLLCVLFLLAATGCGQNPRHEPGLFGHNHPSTGPTASYAPIPTNPDLPVLGERIWTSGDGRALPFRIAIHGLRRVDGATLLDWSVTPLAQVGLRPGERLRVSGPGDANYAESFRLIDSDHQLVYHPLIGKQTHGCLCSIAHGLQVGLTTMQQVAFPPIPGSVHTISVDIPGIALFTDVPIPPIDNYLGATSAVDLNRSPDLDEVIRWSPTFSYAPAGGQRLRIGVIAVDAAPTATTVVWSIWSITSGTGLSSTGGPPITAGTDTSAHRSTASGLELAVPGTRSRPIPVWRESTTNSRDGDCLCTNLRGGWASGMNDARRSVTVISNLPALPFHTQFVDVILPGVARIERVPVTEAEDAGSRVSGPIVDVSGFITPSPPYRPPARTGAAPNWPTPRPAHEIVRQFRAVVDRLS